MEEILAKLLGAEVIAWKWQTLCTCGWEAHSC